MKESNIYDIDGELIRRGDQGAFTLEETEELVDKLTKKVQENPDNQVYKVYLNNAQKWLFKLYNEMSKEDIMKRMSFLTNSVNEAKTAASESEQRQIEEINKAIEDLKKAYDNESEDPNTASEEDGEQRLDREMEHPMDVASFTDVNSESSLEEPSPTNDEYVEFEEVKDGQ